MMRIVVILAISFFAVTVKAQHSKDAWYFGPYSFRAGYCKDGSTAITIFHNDDTLYKHCGGDPVSFTFVDTLSLNDDNRPDFVYMYVDEYYTVGLLVSQPKGGYKDVYVTDIFEFDPNLYKAAMPLPAPIVPISLRDINNDGRRDMLVGSLDRKTDYTIPGYTQVITYSQLRRLANEKILQKK